MSEGIEAIEWDGETLALIVRSTYAATGVNFLTPGHLSQQLAYIQHATGHIIGAHQHKLVPRTVVYTQETLFVRRGRLRVDFYNDSQGFLESRELASGDVILLIKGGHGFEVLEDVEMIEVKQGPYAAESDKIRFRGIRPRQAD